jgi:hypothetical protein
VEAPTPPRSTCGPIPAATNVDAGTTLGAMTGVGSGATDGTESATGRVGVGTSTGLHAATSSSTPSQAMP